MATTLYLRNDLSPTPTTLPSDFLGSWTTKTSTYKGSAGFGLTTVIGSGPTSVTATGSPISTTRMACAQYISPTLNAGTITTANLTLWIGASETFSTWGGCCAIYLVNGATGAIRTVLHSVSTFGNSTRSTLTEQSCYSAGLSNPGATITAGDYIVVEIGFQHSAATSGTFTLYANGITTGATDQAAVTTPASYLTIADTLTFQSASVPTEVQGTWSDPGATSTGTTCTFSLAQTAGNVNVVAIGFGDTTSTVSSVADTQGNTYQVGAALTRGSSGTSQVMYYAQNIAAHAVGNVITVTMAGSTAWLDVRVAEYGPVYTPTPFLGGASATGTSTSPDSGAIVVPGPNTLLYAAGSTTTHFTVGGASFVNEGITTTGGITEDRVVAAGTFHGTGTTTSGVWVMQMLAFADTAYTPPSGGHYGSLLGVGT